ncbi:hypothetical protein PFX98_12030 [Paucibacter sediminis]|uniref:Uncharacterized protein n=1 Tax=Paucibacter sediminis TaxID=3019553 RepID=A0AA95SZF0_9BURK|nr:hypothetical protein [Paucibacter sp. S2-9]WIT14314.1 hypothetical protein PFX98_12030 [Paucibacter sp. S2-9]
MLRIPIYSPKFWAAVALCAALAVANAVEPPPIRIVKGACGTLRFGSQLASDYKSALAIVQARYDAGAFCTARDVPCRNEPFEITVTPEQNTRFFALKVLDSKGMLVHSVSQVLTTDGRAFNIQWCPD